MITYNILNKYKEIAHFCTTREGGVSVGNYASFNLSPFSGDDEQNFKANKTNICNLLHISNENLIIPYQTHQTEIRKIDKSFFQLTSDKKEKYLHGVDGLFTQLPGVCIGITTADCVPLLFFDPIQKVVAASHAGWRGTCANIAAKTVQELIKNFNSQPSNIRVTIGPSISGKVYEVGKEVVENFEIAGFNTTEIVSVHNNAFYLDLWKANFIQLQQSGILDQHIEISGICTYTEHDKFFSARRLGIKSGRMLSGIKLNEKY